MADFEAVIRKAVDGLINNSPENRAKVYDKARSAVIRQLENMKPRPPEELLRRQLAKLDAAIASAEETYPGNLVEAESLPHPSPEIVPPHIPRQQPGLSFGLNPQLGLVTVQPSGRASGEDLGEIGDLHKVLVEATDDLILLTNGSNAYGQVDRIAKRYRRSLQNDEGDIEIGSLYAYGIRLENSARGLRKQIDTGDFPSLSHDLAEAIESVIAIHGPLILSTALGRELLNKNRAYAATEIDDEKYRETAISLWRDAKSSQRIVFPDDMEQVIQIIADMNESDHRSRTNDLARTTNSNLLATLAKLIIPVTTVTSTIVISKGFENSTIGMDASQGVTTLINNGTNFFFANKESLRLLAGLAGSELSWIDPFLRWLYKKSVEKT